MKKINVPIRNYKGFLLSLMPFLLTTSGLIFLSFIAVKLLEDTLNLKYLFIVILLVCLYFFYISIKGLLFTLYGTDIILYNDEEINVNSSVFKISSVIKFKWDDIETVGVFSPNNKSGISESLGIKPKDKPFFFFGHLMKDSEKMDIAKELLNFFNNRKDNNAK